VVVRSEGGGPGVVQPSWWMKEWELVVVVIRGEREEGWGGVGRRK
jgi:hypothetical protein